jgi:hypothetical protein
MMGMAMKNEDKAPLSKKERLNRNLLIGCMVLGGIMGMTMGLVESQSGSDDMALFSSAPLPINIALILAFVWAVILPSIAWYWHRYAIDEQERHAYREGAYYAFYAYIIGAPLWWVLWRGGLVPEPNGIIIYYVTLSICGVVWLWKKYR